MASVSPRQETEIYALPQYGFGANVDFDSLIKGNHFLFRVYTPRGQSSSPGSIDPFFIAPKFNDKYNTAPEQLSTSREHVSNQNSPGGTYEDVARHMDWTTRSFSPYISTSFSFMWSIWEALRRYHFGVKKGVEIAIMDARSLSGKAVTAVQLLQMSIPEGRRREHWKWYRFSQESQSVLVYESIPGTAVLASIPLLSILEKLPSYLLRHDISVDLKRSPLAAIAWDYTDKTRSYRQFCQSLSRKFLQSSPEIRLQDTTTGSVRLALSFLRPWFHRCVMEDIQIARKTLCALAFLIARWPGQWRTHDHLEIWNLIQSVALAVSEEVRVGETKQIHAEVTRLQGVIIELEDVVRTHQAHAEIFSPRDGRNPAQSLASLVIPALSRSTPISSPFAPLASSALSFPPPPAGPRVFVPPATSPLPPTPPLSPIDAPISPVALSNGVSGVPPVVADPPFPPSSPSIVTLGVLPHLKVASALPEPIRLPLLPKASSSLAVLAVPNDLSLVRSRLAIEPLGLSLPLSSPSRSFVLPRIDMSHALQAILSTYPSSAPPVTAPSPSEKGRVRKPPSVAETASCAITGFLVGAFITLCLFSPHRRTLLTNLT